MAKRKTYDTEFKRQVVARVLAGKSSGEETLTAIAKDLKIHPTNIHNWIAAASGGKAKKAKPKKAKPKKAKPKKGARTASRPLRVVTEPDKPPSLDEALAAIEVGAAQLRAVRDAYRRMFGGGQ